MGSMSWSDDIRCLHCDGRLPLYRKITHGQFCSNAHRKAYWQEQERLAVERLHQTHDSLQAYRELVPADPAGLPAQPSTELMAAAPAPSGLTSSALTSPRLPSYRFHSVPVVPEDWNEPQAQLQKPGATEPPWAGYLRTPLPSVPVRWTRSIVWNAEGFLIADSRLARPDSELAPLFEEPVIEPVVSADEDLPWAAFVLPPVRSAAPQTAVTTW